MRILASPAFINKKINPYNSLLYHEIKALDVTHPQKKHTVCEYSHKKALLEQFDIVHFHWPDGYINQPRLGKAVQRVLLFAVIILALTFKRQKIVWTVHNATPHDAYHPKLSNYFMNWFIRRCDGFIFMSTESRTQFLSLYKKMESTDYAIIPHGHYRNSYHAGLDTALAKAQLGLPADKKVLLFCGMIKPYKNIDSLIKIFMQANIPNTVLLIAGDPSSDTHAENLRRLQSNHANVYLFLNFIPDETLHNYLSAADAVILPYKHSLNSGALLLALSFNKPVIAPNIGAFIATQKELGVAWIHCYEGELSASTLTYALEEVDRLKRPEKCPLENYEWSKLATSTVAFYQCLFLKTSPTNQTHLL